MTNVADLTSVEKIIVLDFGSQFNQLITRRIREFGVFSELLSHRTTAEEIRKIAPKGIIFSGGPNSVYDKDAFSIDPEIYELGIPILGICYGMQLMTHNLGGKVEPAANREYGKAELEILGDATLFQGTPAKQTVWMSHGDLVTEIALDSKSWDKQRLSNRFYRRCQPQILRRTISPRSSSFRIW